MDRRLVAAAREHPGERVGGQERDQHERHDEGGEHHGVRGDLRAELVLVACSRQRRQHDDADPVGREQHHDEHRIGREEAVGLGRPAEVAGDDDPDDAGEPGLHGERDCRDKAAAEGPEPAPLFALAHRRGSVLSPAADLAALNLRDASRRHQPCEHQRRRPGRVDALLRRGLRHGADHDADVPGPGAVASARRPAAPPLPRRVDAARAAPHRDHRRRLRRRVSSGEGAGVGSVRLEGGRAPVAAGAAVLPRPGRQPDRAQLRRCRPARPLAVSRRWSGSRITFRSGPSRSAPHCSSSGARLPEQIGRPGHRGSRRRRARSDGTRAAACRRGAARR